MEEEKKSNRGGKREGAGRKTLKELGITSKAKKNYDRKPSLSIVGTKEELEALRKLASESDKTVSRFVLDTLLTK